MIIPCGYVQHPGRLQVRPGRERNLVVEVEAPAVRHAHVVVHAVETVRAPEPARRIPHRAAVNRPVIPVLRRIRRLRVRVPAPDRRAAAPPDQYHVVGDVDVVYLSGVAGFLYVRYLYRFFVFGEEVVFLAWVFP